MDVELRQLRALIAVVDEGTFTDAAIALGTSQASVSRAVLALERALGARVLRRTTREVGLTAVGRGVVGHARRCLAEVDAIRDVVGAGTAQLRVGYAWSALGRHTTAVQKRWAAEHSGSTLTLVQFNTRLAGLGDGAVDLAVLRGEVSDERLVMTLLGQERRYAAVPAGDPLAQRRAVRLADFTGRTIGIDPLSGTTTPDLWAAGTAPATRVIHGVDEWLSLIAAEQALGITSEATVRQHPRPGVVYRRISDAPTIPVWLAWRRDDVPPQAEQLAASIRELFAT